jgi:hypothetical protein
MNLLKVKNPVRPLTTNTVHHQLHIVTLQDDDTESKMIITVNEDFCGDIWMGVNVDGKFHSVDFHLREFIKIICKLSSNVNENDV